MKRIEYFIIVMSILFLFSGCAGVQIVREVDENNVFYSSAKPEIKIKVKEYLKFANQRDRSRSASSWSGGESTTNRKFHSYIFESNDSPAKTLIITISRYNSSMWSFSSEIFDTSNTLDSGTMMLDGKEFQYITYVEKSDENTKYLKKIIAKRCGSKNNIMLYISYKESLAENWPDELENNINILASEQIITLREFSSTFNNAFEIL